MTINTENIPICKCHNELMMWDKDNRLRLNGRWKCKEKNRQSSRKYRKNNPIKIYIYHRKYDLYKIRKNIIQQLEELNNVR